MRRWAVLSPFSMAWLALASLALASFPSKASAQGQSRWVVTPFAASDGALPGRPLLAGVSLARFADPFGGLFGVRFGLAASTRGARAGALERPPGDGAWATDADALLSLARLPGLGRLAGLDPRLFVGLGVESAIGADAARATKPAWSWGAGASWRVASWLSADVEARRRSAFAVEPPAGFEPGWEARAGVALHLGRAGGPRGAGGRSGPPRPLAGAGSGVRGSSGSPGSDPGAAGGLAARDAGAADVVAYRAIADGEAFLGRPYIWGGSDPERGFDCSGFVQYVFGEEGIRLPRTSRQMARSGEELPAELDALRPGDLMFFADEGDRIDHVAIYAGERRILHSSSSGEGVRYDTLSGARGRWFLDHFVAARRVLGAAVAGTRGGPAAAGLLGEPVDYDRGDRAPPVEHGAGGGSGS